MIAPQVTPSTSRARGEAARWVDAALRGSTPEPPFRRIVSAKFEGRGRHRAAIGVLEMFDGRPATIEVGWHGLWCCAWRELDGGACQWNGRTWQRVKE